MSLPNHVTMAKHVTVAEKTNKFFIIDPYGNE